MTLASSRQPCGVVMSRDLDVHGPLLRSVVLSDVVQLSKGTR